MSQFTSDDTKYPCGTCDATVDWKLGRGMPCETCGQWYHLHCQDIGDRTRDSLRQKEGKWYCVLCDNYNYSTVAFDLHGIDSRSCSALLDPSQSISIPFRFTEEDPFVPHHTSTPTRASQQDRNSAHRPLRFLNINLRSAPSKVPMIASLIESSRPDVIICTETWLDGDIRDAEIFPSNYKVFRRDRSRHRGGVAIAVTEELNCTEEPELFLDDCEILWIKLKLKKSRSLLICTYYRPDEGDEPSLKRFAESARLASLSQNAIIVIGGDFNFPGWDWKKGVLKKCRYPSLHNFFRDTLHDLGWEQLVTFPTREENALDLFLTNSPGLVPRVSPLCGLSDHDAVYMELQIQPPRKRQVRRTIPLYDKTNMEDLKRAAAKVSNDITNSFTEVSNTEEI